ncbi:MAG TPA: hypothetical protein VIG51_06845 [Candidatus Baltobacteraceae bacterium]|jgi:hypothetical protein
MEPSARIGRILEAGMEGLPILKQVALVALVGVAGLVAPAVAAEHGKPVVVSTTPTTGALSLHVEPATGAEAVRVNCAGPANAPVTITLFATLSSDIPTVVVSRHDFTIDRSGQLSTTISIASDFVRGSILTVRVTSLDTVVPAQASLLVGAPNPHVSVPLEQLPAIFTH